MIEELKRRIAIARPMPWKLGEMLTDADWDVLTYLTGTPGPALPELVKLAEQAKPKKRIKFYVHPDKDALFDRGTEAGLTEKQLERFKHFCEVELEVDVDDDGICSLVSARV